MFLGNKTLSLDMPYFLREDEGTENILLAFWHAFSSPDQGWLRGFHQSGSNLPC